MQLLVSVINTQVQNDGGSVTILKTNEKCENESRNNRVAMNFLKNFYAFMLLFFIIYYYLNY